MPGRTWLGSDQPRCTGIPSSVQPCARVQTTFGRIDPNLRAPPVKEKPRSTARIEASEDIAQTEQERASALIDHAMLFEDELSDLESATDALKQALEADPQSSAAALMLERLSRRAIEHRRHYTFRWRRRSTKPKSRVIKEHC